MTHRYVRKTCPYCKKTISSETYVGSKRELWGSPLSKCPHCGQIVVDNEYDELARWEYDKNKYGFGDFLYTCWAPLLLGLIPAICIFFSNLFNGLASDELFLYILIALGFLAFFWGIPIIIYVKRKPAKQAEYKKAWEASNKRLQNKQYVMFLKNSGYFFPYAFTERIENAQKDNNTETDVSPEESARIAYEIERQRIKQMELEEAQTPIPEAGVNEPEEAAPGLLSDAQAEAVDILSEMDEDSLKKLIKIAKAMQED